METTNYLTIDKERANIYSQELTVLFREVQGEELMTVLNAYTMALVNFATEVKRLTHSDTHDATEILVLTWLRNTDKVSGMNFSKYINLNTYQI